MGSLYGVDNTGLIQTAAGIRFTANTNPAVFNNYQDNVSHSFTLTGPWSVSRSLTIRFFRIGRLVFAGWADLPAQTVTVAGQSILASGGSGSQTTLAAFIPSLVVGVSPCVVYDGTAPNGAPGDAKATSSGSGYFINFRAPNGGSFTSVAGISQGIVLLGAV